MGKLATHYDTVQPVTKTGQKTQASEEVADLF